MGAKTSVRSSKSWKKHFGADIHDPKARTSMAPGGFLKNFGQKNFGLNFRSLAPSLLFLDREMAGMSADFGRDVPGSEKKLDARNIGLIFQGGTPAERVLKRFFVSYGLSYENTKNALEMKKLGP